MVAAQAAVIEQQTARIEELTAQVTELTRRLGQNSGNSSLPPSSDRFVKSKRDRRRSTARRPGKQPGAPGSGLALVADPDEVVEHVPVECAGCGGDLADAEEAGAVVRQVRDVPPVRVRVTEHRMHKRVCGCGTVTSAPARGWRRPGWTGRCATGRTCEPWRTLAVYLVVFQHVAVERAAVLIADLTGAAVSTGWVSAQVGRTAQALVEVEALIKTLITLATVIGADETTVKVAGTRHWLHVARTELLTAYHLHASRGRQAVEEFGLLADYTGTLVRDALSVHGPHGSYPARHALCGAHLIRELTAVAETHPEQDWPTQARSALADLAQAARNAREQGLSAIPAEVAATPLMLFRHADNTVLVGLARHRRAPGRKQTKARNLLERMPDRQAEILRFTTDLDVPFTNNGSERDLRPVKTQIKISGCHRSTTGAQAWVRIRGYISTVRKHGDDVFTALHDAITGNPWRPPSPAT